MRPHLEVKMRSRRSLHAMLTPFQFFLFFQFLSFTS
jgi:hypothetical protein